MMNSVLFLCTLFIISRVYAFEGGDEFNARDGGYGNSTNFGCNLNDTMNVYFLSWVNNRPYYTDSPLKKLEGHGIVQSLIRETFEEQFSCDDRNILYAKRIGFRTLTLNTIAFQNITTQPNNQS